MTSKMEPQFPSESRNVAKIRALITELSMPWDGPAACRGLHLISGTRPLDLAIAARCLLAVTEQIDMFTRAVNLSINNLGRLMNNLPRLVGWTLFAMICEPL